MTQNLKEEKATNIPKLKPKNFERQEKKKKKRRKGEKKMLPICSHFESITKT